MPRHIMAFAVRPRADRLLAAVMREYAYNTQGETLPPQNYQLFGQSPSVCSVL